jgi:beta-ureidopropionase / N-carbamoyl-L-amino-acid hydrolase
MLGLVRGPHSRTISAAGSNAVRQGEIFHGSRAKWSQAQCLPIAAAAGAVGQVQWARTMARVSDLVDGERLWERLMALARFGATAAGGVRRLALSPEEIAARAALVAWGRAFGLTPSVDAAANLFLTLTGAEPHLPSLLIGSHLDSQPTGGKFDGAYGVVAALEAAQAICEYGRRPRRSIEIVAWMNEEGARFAPGMMGSAAFTGRRGLADIMAVADRSGCSVATALTAVLGAERDLARRPLGFPVAGYIEAHIEQGSALEKAGRTIGVVTGMQGKRTFRVEVIGEESHAGATPLRLRRDALTSAVAVVDALHKEMSDPDDLLRFTIGLFDVSPNAPSVVPGKVVFAIDLRHPVADVIERLGNLVPRVCEIARGRCEVSVRELLHEAPLTFPDPVQTRIRAAAERLRIPHMQLPSPAGHDARYLHYVCPTGMIFIPCKDGISHNERESITPGDATAGARVLTETAFELADR